MGAGGGEELLTQIRVRAIAEGQQAIATMQQTLKTLGTDTAVLAQNQKTGAAAARDHAAAQHEVGVAIKSTHQFVPDLTDRIKTMTAAGHGASFGFRMIKSSMAEMALESLGAKGPLSKLAEGMVVFSAGSGPMIAVAAGITLTALLFEKLSGAAEGAAQRLKEAGKAGEEAAKRSLDPVGVRRAQVGALRADDREIMQRLGSLRQDLPLAQKGAANPFDEEAQADLSRIQALIERYETKHVQNLHEQHAIVFADFEIAKRELEVKLQAAGKDAEEATFLELKAKYGNENAARGQLDLENRTTYLTLIAELHRQTRAIAETDLARYAETLKASKTLTSAQIADLTTQRQALTYAEQLHKAQEALTDAAGTALDRRTRELTILGLQRGQINDILALEARRQAVTDLGTLRGTLSDTGRPRVLGEGAQSRINDIVGAITDAGLDPQTGKRGPVPPGAAQRGLETRGTALADITKGLDEAIKHIKENAKQQEEAGRKIATADKAQEAASKAADQALGHLAAAALQTGLALRDVLSGKVQSLGAALTGISHMVEQAGTLSKALAGGGTLGPLGAGLAIGGSIASLLGGLFSHSSRPTPVQLVGADRAAAAEMAAAYALAMQANKPESVTIQVINSGGDSLGNLQVDLANATKRDRIIRLPRDIPVGT